MKKMTHIIKIIRILLFCTVVLLLGGCKQVLYSGLTEIDATEMMAILIRTGIDANKLENKDGLYALQVDKQQLPNAVEILQRQGFPREEFKSMGDVFKKEGLISSPLEERVRFIYALSQNVAETLTQIDGVIIARVHIVMPENNPFGDAVAPASASVFIKYRPESNLEESKADIKLIVEKSIEGLRYGKVTVVMIPAKNLNIYNANEPVSGQTGIVILVVSFMVAAAFLIWLLVKFIPRRQLAPTRLPQVK